MIHPFIALLALQAAAAQPAASGALQCYGTHTQIGTVAARRFFDARGFVEKEVFYTGEETCAAATLRVQRTITYKRDADGRPISEVHCGPEGAFCQTWTIEYHGSGDEFHTRTVYDFSGRRERQIRNAPNGQTVLWFDEVGRVAALDGQQPDDIPSAIAWGPVVEGWACGLGMPIGRPASGNGPVVVHLLNRTGRDQSAAFITAFETDLRDASGRYVEPKQDYPAGEQGPRGLIEAGNARYTYAVDLDGRYGRLPPGTYTLTVRHPHPVIAASLVCGAVTIGIR